MGGWVGVVAAQHQFSPLSYFQRTGTTSYTASVWPATPCASTAPPSPYREACKPLWPSGTESSVTGATAAAAGGGRGNDEGALDRAGASAAQGRGARRGRVGGRLGKGWEGWVARARGPGRGVGVRCMAPQRDAAR